MDVEAYLRRIAYDGPRDPSATTLRNLHRQHLFTVPFENLDIALGTPIRLEPEALFDKIVTRKRGGFCYELNGLFHDLLAALGFRVEMLSARVHRADRSYSQEFDHMLLKVTLEAPWIADVGFGDSFVDPLLLWSEAAEAATDTPDGKSRFSLHSSDGEWDLLRRDNGDSPVPLYRFTEVARRLNEFDDMCHFHQTSPESHFTQNHICSKATPDGRVTISGIRLIITRNGARQESVLKDEDQWRECLREHFGIGLVGDVDWRRLAT
jgi:N-hydroxyarylamine O-acetyltransferase